MTHATNDLQTPVTTSNNWRVLLLLLITLYTLTASYALRPQVVTDFDIGWHLRTGQWIVEHHAVPLTDAFSRPLQGQRWFAYSWLFEVLLYGLFSLFGWPGIVGLTAALSLLIVLALFTQLRLFVTDERRAVFYAFMGALGLAALCNPRPWLFTILFFIVEYTLLVAARQTGQPRKLWWLVPLFVLWANLHIQFIYGLFLLGFDTVQPWLEQLLRRDFAWNRWRAQIDWRRWMLLLACTLATFATPYHYKTYRIVLEYANGARAFQLIDELQPLNFSGATPWLVLAIALWALFCLGWQRLTRSATLVLLLIGVLLAFRSQRDLWFLIVVALGIPASAMSQQADATLPPFRITRQFSLQVAAVLLSCLLLGALAHQRKLNNATLQRAVDDYYPAAAVRVIEERGYHGPLYNHFNWGGYLIWRLPQLPVSMDGRTNLYGDDRIVKHKAVWEGERQWTTDPELAAAGIVLADQRQSLSELLRRDPRFELVYEDHVAAVFVPRTPPLAHR